jgi:MFS family permease
LASTSGPVLGAYLTEHFSWRAVFAVNLPLGLIAAILATRIPRPPPTARAGRFHPDVVGALLFCASTVALLFALSSGGHRFAWTSWTLLALLAAAAVGVIVLLLWERRVANPVIPVRFLRIPAIVRSDAVVVCFAAALFSTILYLPLYLQLGRGLGVGTSGLLLLPVTLSMVVSSAVTGQMVTRTGLTTVFPQAGLTLATIALAALAVTVTGAPTAVVMGLTMLVGMGLGMVMPPTQVTVQLAAGRESLGAATGSISLSRALGGAIGVAIIGAILFAQVAQAGDAFAALLHEVVEGGPAYVLRMAPAARDALGAQIDHVYRLLFLVIAGFTATGALIARTIPKPEWSG